jgi:hypothetical protein
MGWEEKFIIFSTNHQKYEFCNSLHIVDYE